MRKSPYLFLLLPVLICTFPAKPAWVQEPENLHGQALKDKMASIQFIQGLPEIPFKKLAPIWASKSDMNKTLQDLRKQAAKMGADAVIQIQVRTEKLESTSYDPGWWGGPGWGGGFGPYGGGPGYWGTMGYWGGYAQAHTYTQPVVSGWAIKWEGVPPENIPTFPLHESLQQQVEEAPE